MSVTISIQNALKKYGENTVIPNLSVDIKPGEFFTLLGPSGCGKTTLLRMIAGFNSIEGGDFYFNDKRINDLDPAKRNIGMVFQNYAIFPHMTVRKNVEFGLKNKKLPKDQIKAQADEFMQLMHVDQYADRLPERLSGGQQQRVALARALCIKPDVLLFDEPLSNLDAKVRLEMRSEIRRIQQETGVTTIFVTHDQEEAMSITDEIVLMRKGVVQQQSSPQKMYTNPENEFVAFFLGSPSISFFKRQVKGGEVEIAQGYTVKTNAEDGQVSVGIRPEAWALGEGITVRVEGVELRGKDLIVSFTLGNDKTCAILDANEVVSVGDSISLALKHAYVYLFDAENGKRLPAEVYL